MSGPFLRSLRSEFRDFGPQPINRKARDIAWENGELSETEFAIRDTKGMIPFLSRIWDVYKGFTPIQLTNMTHEPGTPWHQVATHYNFMIPPNTTIPNELIRAHFRDLQAAK